MTTFLFIPWFKAEAWHIPLPFEAPFFGHSLPIQPFGLLVATGVLLGFRIGEEFSKRNGFSPLVFNDFGLHAVGFGFLGGYILNTVFYDPQEILAFFTQPGHMRIHWTGLSSYGGFFGAAFGIWIWHKRRNLPILRIADAGAFCLVFGWLFGRLGCFVVHDHPGRVTDFFLAVDQYHVGQPPYLPRHDLGFYEVLWSLAVCGLFTYLFFKKTVRPSGFYLALELVLYAPVRFALDFLRAEAAEGGDVRYFGLTPGHYSSIVFFLLGLAVLRRALAQGVQELPEAVKWPPKESTPAAAGAR
ncbi:MAG: prolipoprotein diacylglyceryl transferase family protein [Polyangiales bacterium]